MKQGILWLGVCLMCVCYGMLTDDDRAFYLAGALLLICMLQYWRSHTDPERQDRPLRENSLWETFRKEFASSLAKAMVSLLMALAGVLLLGGVVNTATPAEIGVSLGAIILSALGGL